MGYCLTLFFPITLIPSAFFLLHLLLLLHSTDPSIHPTKLQQIKSPFPKNPHHSHSSKSTPSPSLSQPAFSQENNKKKDAPKSNPRQSHHPHLPPPPAIDIHLLALFAPPTRHRQFVPAFSSSVKPDFRSRLRLDGGGGVVGGALCGVGRVGGMGGSWGWGGEVR